MANVLPPELLAACFRFLPLLDLITASHVSRDWRATALAFPDLWATIEIDGFSQPLLAEVLGRSGNVPLSIEITARTDYALAPVLAPYVRRMRSFVADRDHGFGLKLFDRPAPLLKQLDFPCTDAITEDFLGGCSGALKRLCLAALEFPESGVCPAVSTVTDLRISDSPRDEVDYGSLDKLFEFCPLLERLHLDGLTSDTELPTGRAPRTLRALSLATTSPHRCLLSTLRDWQADTLTETTLKFSHKSLTRTSGEALRGLLAGIVALEIFFTREMDTAFHAVDSRGRVVNMTVLDVKVVRHVTPLISPLFELGVGTLRTLGIVDAQLPGLKLPIPSLETLTLGMCFYSGVTEGFQWSRLKRLADLGPGRLRVTVEVRCRKRLGESDVREIMESLAFVGDNVEGDIDMKIVLHHTAQDAVRQAGFADSPPMLGKLGIVEISYGSYAIVDIKYGKYWPSWEF